MGTLVLNGATSGSTTLSPVDAVTATITLPSATATLATLGANTFTGNQSITGTVTAEIVLAQSQPMFSAYLSTSATNVTGMGANYTVIFNTEVFDISSSYNNATGVFTAPYTGRYRIGARVTLDDLSTAMTVYSVAIATTTRNCTSKFAANSGSNPNNQITLSVDDYFSMTAGDTASVVVNVANGAGVTADVLGSADGVTSFFAELVS
jgi:chaperonin GroEL (HSP60 family)